MGWCNVVVGTVDDTYDNAKASVARIFEQDCRPLTIESYFIELLE